MNNPNTLEDYYRYWDKFYEAWRHNDMNTIKCLGWTDANKDGVSACYLPEPWWGNSGGVDQPLESVVINFNPGSGGTDQERSKFQCKSSYRGFVRDQVLRYIMNLKNMPILKTNNWHNSKRAVCINDALGQYVDVSTFTLKNHLSIELVPWHTTSSTEIVRYCTKNRQAIFEHSIKFAAKAATHIQNPILSGVVLLRMSSSFFKQIMGGIGGLNYLVEEHAIYNNVSSSSSKTPPNSDDSNLVVKSIKELDHNLIEKVKAYYCLFEFSSIPGVKFACIWGPKTRNSFPKSDYMKEIIKQIIIFKLTNL